MSLVLYTQQQLFATLVMLPATEIRMELPVTVYTGDADKSLTRPGRKQAAPVKSVMGRGID